MEAVKATTTSPKDVSLATDTVAFTLFEKLVIDLTQQHVGPSVWSEKNCTLDSTFDFHNFTDTMIAETWFRPHIKL